MLMQGMRPFRPVRNAIVIVQDLLDLMLQVLGARGGVFERDDVHRLLVDLALDLRVRLVEARLRVARFHRGHALGFDLASAWDALDF